MLWHKIQVVWGPLVEIGILALGIYYVLTFVRGTRGAAVFAPDATL